MKEYAFNVLLKYSIIFLGRGVYFELSLMNVLDKFKIITFTSKKVYLYITSQIDSF
jgi:hypothetical protein